MADRPQFLAIRMNPSQPFKIYELFEPETRREPAGESGFSILQHGANYRPYPPLIGAVFEDEYTATGVAKGLNENSQKETPEGAEFGGGEK